MSRPARKKWSLYEVMDEGCLKDGIVADKNEWIDKKVLQLIVIWITTGGRLNKKDGLTRYGDSHVKDKTS